MPRHLHPTTAWQRPDPQGGFINSSDTRTEAPPAQRLLPVDDDLDTSGIFAAAKNGKIAVRRCNTCDAVHHVPVMYCRHCGSWDGRWQDVAGTGALYSWTVVTHQVHPAFPVPYTVVLVDLDELPGTHFLGHIDGRPELHAGQPMEAWFEAVEDTSFRSGGRQPADHSASRPLGQLTTRPADHSAS